MKKLLSQRVRRGMVNSSLDEYSKIASDESTVSTSALINTLSTTPTSTATTVQTAAARKHVSPPIAIVVGSGTTGEPKKPLSPYALFFRDTVFTIKQENPQCPFPEISLIVTSMWETLDEKQRSFYQIRAENEREEYLKQMRDYTKRRDLEQHQEMEQQESQHYDISNQFQKNALQTKPAVFTITRPNSLDELSADLYNQMIDQSEATAKACTTATTSSGITATTTISAVVQPPQPTGVSQSYLQHQQQRQQQANSVGNQSTEVQNNGSEQMRMLSEAGSVPKCTRDGCNKLAIINPDWEDEYCSNECVVQHCKTVFNNWVLENKANASSKAP